MVESEPPPTQPVFSAADIGALAHLYRGEVYRSTVWRTRLDATTNWAVVATGIALSVTFSSASASPLPLALVGLLVAVFLTIEARRYRFFDFWRMRAHVLELQFFGPDPARPGRADRQWLERDPLPGLHPPQPAYQPARGRRPPAAPQLWLDLHHPGRGLCRQAADPSRADRAYQRGLAAGRGRADPGPARPARRP